MDIQNETLDFTVYIYNQGKCISYDCGLNKSPIIQYNIEDIYSSVILLKANFKDIYNIEYLAKWVFKLDITNKSLYRIIEDQIREEARNNVYDNEDKKLLKLFVKRYGKRTEEEIAEIFNEKENIINQPEIIIPQIIEEKPIIKPYENLQCGLIEPNKNESLYPGRSANIYDIQKLIDEMYSSSAIDGTKGEVSSNSIYYNERNILPFNYIKDNILSDFYNFGYYNDYQYQLEYILFCIYESMPNRINYLNFIRFIAPIRINEYSQETVLDAVIEYFNDISGRVSKEYQRRIDAFQKIYNK